MKSKMKRNTAGVLAGILLGTAFLGGCSNPVSTILEKPVFKVGKESCSREDARAILAGRPEIAIICDEVGNGIVPMDAFEREYRERLGRFLIEVAKRADRVERIMCGIGQRIK